MSSNKGVIALGFLVGVAIVAGILRIKFYFDPPEDRFTNQVDQILTNALTEPVIVADTIETTTVDTVNQTMVTPMMQMVTPYQLSATVHLGDGLLLSLLPETDGAIGVLLRGTELLVQRYDAAWQLLPDSTKSIQQDVQLISGAPPVAKLFAVDDGYRLVLTQGNNDTQAVLLLSLAADGTVQSTVTLLSGLSALEGIITTVTTDAVWVYVAGGQLHRFSLSDSSVQMIQEFSLVDATVGVCALMPDGTDIMIVSESATELVFNKETEFGVLLQSVAVPRPDSLVGCTGVVRYQDQLVVQLLDRLVPYNDNLTNQYPAIRFTGSELYPFTVLSNTGLWLAYSTSSTLGAYTIQVQEYVTPVVVE